MSRGGSGSWPTGCGSCAQAPDLAALRGAGSPEDLARLALVPAGRNLGIAVGFCRRRYGPRPTAALLACRVLDAYEDLSDRPVASGAVMAAVDYLNGVPTHRRRRCTRSPA